MHRTGVLRAVQSAGMKRIALAVVLAALAFPATGAMLYKSVGPNGTVTFSDVPPSADSRLLEQRAISSQGSITTIAATTVASVANLLDFDAAVAQANAQVDLAEHALALARREHWSPRDGLRLTGKRLTLADRDRLEFYQRNVKIARQSLMELLRERMVASR